MSVMLYEIYIWKYTCIYRMGIGTRRRRRRRRRRTDSGDPLADSCHD